MPKMHLTALGSLLFECPCGDLHVIYPVGCAAQHPARWQWNGSLRRADVFPVAARLV
ncbi:hypothetical protein L810_1185 [Burkholderia sp. AU4i]|uniref:hypothetical protein n=1 Tax=Burkholderia sp. AU4i TaxID=1335308 RepID=UPI000398C8BB|nr:hypothetical protein [Burkholderia sp. AU4i]ERJ35927.1 hypothetical protein L810_1185 [Burkholderia sp. AU4i]